MRLPRAICLLFLPLAACGSFKKEKPVADNRTGQARVIGVIEMVNPEQNYVLINCEQRPYLPAGTELIALDPTGAKSKIVVTPERKGNYLTADIKEGTPTVSSLVLQKIRESDTLPPPPVPGAPATVTAPAVMPMPVEQAEPGTLPPIPPVEFPGQPVQAPQITPAEALPLPKPLVPPAEPPPADLTKLPPIVR